MMRAILCAACGDPVAIEATVCVCGASPLLHERYQLLAIVGRGASGVTYRATDLRTQGTVAVKEMPLRVGADDVRRGMDREARVLSELRHPQIPDHVEHFVEGRGKHRAFYLVQAFVEGETLADEVAARRYTEAEVVTILDEVLALLGYLHSLAPPVIHRDLKPGNIIRNTEDGRLVLIDFGAVRDVLADPVLGGSTVSGTYGYMAPEQFRGEASEATDLYAVGVMGVVMLSRLDPLVLARGDHSLDWEGRTHASPRLKVLLRQLLLANPEDRPQHTHEVRAALRALHEPTPAPSAPAPSASAPSAPTTLAAFVPRPMPVPKHTRGIGYLSRAERARRQAHSKGVTLALSLGAGFFGLHHFYLGRFVAGVASVLFSWSFVPLAISAMEGVRILSMTQGDFDAAYNPGLNVACQDPEQLAQALGALHQLVDEGALSRVEFGVQRARLLGQCQPSWAVRVFDALLTRIRGR